MKHLSSFLLVIVCLVVFLTGTPSRVEATEANFLQRSERRACIKRARRNLKSTLTDLLFATSKERREFKRRFWKNYCGTYSKIERQLGRMLPNVSSSFDESSSSRALGAGSTLFPLNSDFEEGLSDWKGRKVRLSANASSGINAVQFPKNKGFVLQLGVVSEGGDLTPGSYTLLADVLGSLSPEVTTAISVIPYRFVLGKGLRQLGRYSVTSIQMGGATGGEWRTVELTGNIPKSADLVLVLVMALSDLGTSEASGVPAVDNFRFLQGNSDIKPTPTSATTATPTATPTPTSTPTPPSAPQLSLTAPRSSKEGSAIEIIARSTSPGTIAVDLGDGSPLRTSAPQQTLFIVSHAYMGDAAITITGSVETESDGSASDTAQHLVRNVSPTADAGGPYSGSAGQAVLFSGAATDPGDDEFTYSWNFGDGNTTTEQSPSHTYSVAGSYTVTLTVRDDDGGVGTDTAQVTIQSNDGDGGDNGNGPTECDDASGAVIEIDEAWLADNGPVPYYLDQESTTYQLLVPQVSTDGTAFAIIADNITLDLCGNEVIYNDDAPIVIENSDFEILDGTDPTHASDWDFTDAPDITLTEATSLSRYSNLHGTVAQINFPASSQEILSSPFTLQPNTTYSITAIGRRTGAIDKEHVYFGLFGTDTIRNFTNYQGKVDPYLITYTTGDSAEVHRLTFGTLGDADSGYAWMDKVAIQRHNQMGVLFGPRSWSQPSLYNGLTRFGTAANSVVKNGDITQGQDDGTASWPLYFQANGTVAERLTTRSQGIDSGAAFSRYADIALLDNTFLNSSEFTTNRHSFNGYLVQAPHADELIVRNNVFYGGIQGGIVIGDNSTIEGNFFRLFNRFTNGFAVMSRQVENATISDNAIDCTGVDQDGRRADCRGLGFHGFSTNVKAFENLIMVQGQPQNDEYQGCELGGKYAVQFESGTVGGTEFFDNTVLALSDECDAVALRHNKGTGNGDYIHDNVFEARKISSDPSLFATTMRTDAHTGPDAIGLVDNNTFRTNHIWFLGQKTTGLEIHRTRFEVINDSFTTDDFRIYAQTWNSEHGIFGLRFVDSTFGSAQARADFENHGVRRWWNGDRGWRPDSWYEAWYTTTVEASTVSGEIVPNATVAVRNSSNQIVSSGATDQNGLFTDLVRQFEMYTDSSGGVKTDDNPHSVNVSFGALSGNVQDLTIDRASEIAVVID